MCRGWERRVEVVDDVVLAAVGVVGTGLGGIEISAESVSTVEGGGEETGVAVPV